MLGAIIGDTVGSAYEFNNTKDYDFALFTSESNYTDDSVMTVAVAYWLLKDKEHTYRAWRIPWFSSGRNARAPWEAMEAVFTAGCFSRRTCGSSMTVTGTLLTSQRRDAIRKAVSLGGDSDTLACITGGIAEAFYGGVPAEMVERVIRPFPVIFKKILKAMAETTPYGSVCPPAVFLKKENA